MSTSIVGGNVNNLRMINWCKVVLLCVPRHTVHSCTVFSCVGNPAPSRFTVLPNSQVEYSLSTCLVSTYKSLVWTSNSTGLKRNGVSVWACCLSVAFPYCEHSVHSVLTTYRSLLSSCKCSLRDHWGRPKGSFRASGTSSAFQVSAGAKDWPIYKEALLQLQT